MYTADHARQHREEAPSDLDERLQAAVEEANRLGKNTASIRVYSDDAYARRIQLELENRGFTNIDVPDFVLKGDVEFSW
jgi:hypothetical protein